MARYASKRQDMFPNYMSWALTASAATVVTPVKINTPIPRSQVLTGNKAVVMELLWLDCVINNYDTDAQGEGYKWNISTGATPTAVNGIDDGSVICFMQTDNNVVTEGGSTITMPFRLNLQSTDGYGILLATDSFHCSVLGSAVATAGAYEFRLYYRFVQIPITEYIGIVQSQQTAG